MKILIVSDTHNSHRNLERVLEKTEGIDLLIHLGDVEGGEDYIEALVDCPVHIVSGNNDFFSSLPREKEFDIEGRHFFITHGHYYYVTMDEERLIEEAKNRRADIVMYGHTHRPACSNANGLLVINPGSIAYPRQIGRKPTYMIMHIEQNTEPKVELMHI